MVEIHTLSKLQNAANRCYGSKVDPASGASRSGPVTGVATPSLRVSIAGRATLVSVTPDRTRRTKAVHRRAAPSVVVMQLLTDCLAQLKG